MAATIQKRREYILSAAYRGGHVSVSQLAGDIGASEATVRRDLHELASEGLLELTHGGACVIRNSDYSFLSKSMRNIEAKRTIASLAAELVQDGDNIFLGSGTTCFAMTAFLRGKRGLSVIVNSVRTAQELNAPGLNVLILAGQYRPDRMDAVGPMAIASLDKLRGYLAFLGSDGLGMDFGPTAADIESANIVGLAARNARQSILLADHSKFDNTGLYKTTDWANISQVVTDKRPPAEWGEFFASRNVKILCPDNENAGL